MQFLSAHRPGALFETSAGRADSTGLSSSGRNFRNEGLSRKHNPEFTMLEAYQAYGDYETMMELLQSMICHVAQRVSGPWSSNTRIREGKVLKTIDLTPPWKRVRYKDLIREKAGADWFDIPPDERRARADSRRGDRQGIRRLRSDRRGLREAHRADADPAHLRHASAQATCAAGQALARRSEHRGSVRVLHQRPGDCSPAYTEQNDPIVQRERLEHQAGGEQQKLDEDFLVALEHGMPPAGGIGVGIDRLCMMLLGQESIRDVILFPPVEAEVEAASSGHLGAQEKIRRNGPRRRS